MSRNFIALTFAKLTRNRYANTRWLWLCTIAVLASLAAPLRADFIQQIQITDDFGSAPTFSATLGSGFVSVTTQQPDLLQLNGDLIDFSTGTSGFTAVEFLGSPGGSAVGYLGLNLNPVDCSNADQTGHCDQLFSLIFEDVGSSTFTADLNALGAIPSVTESNSFQELDHLLNTFGPGPNNRDILSVQVSGPTPEPGTLTLVMCAGLFVGIRRLRRTI